MKFFLCILLAPLPSLIWLTFYLRKDKHPEPNRMIIKVFLFGALMVPVAGILEQGLAFLSEKISFLNNLTFIVISFALIEEILKYLTVKFGVFKNREFDEPADAMLYMIIAALGFAAAENIYILSQIYTAAGSLREIIETTVTRFLGATFLHALASGIFGYFIAASLLIGSKIRKTLVLGGALAATMLHSIFNYIIILNSQQFINIGERNLYLFIILSITAVVVSLLFRKLCKYRSICKL